MALIDLWNSDKNQVLGKHFQQVIAFAGDGRLGDSSLASLELREFLRIVPTDVISKYADQCLHDSFQDSGLALQDVVNEIGRRLEFSVTPGRYRGTAKVPGHDGVWFSVTGHGFVVEVKTTDAYRIDLDTIAGYRLRLVESQEIPAGKSSMLVVVGRQDTGDLEAQIRGSRHAWDMRIISVEALFRMLRLKEDVEDPSVLTRIHEILVPTEFTRLDQIIDIAFAAVEDVKQVSEPDEPNEDESREKKFVPVAFHQACITRIEEKLETSLMKRSRASFSNSDDTLRVLCSVSRYHERNKRFWFVFHPYQKSFLDGAARSFVAFGCGEATTLFLIPFPEFESWLTNFNRTQLDSRFYWHVQIRVENDQYFMVGRANVLDVEITKFKF